LRRREREEEETWGGRNIRKQPEHEEEAGI